MPDSVSSNILGLAWHGANMLVNLAASGACLHCRRYKDGPSDDLRFYQGGNKVWIRGGSGNMGVGGDPAGNKLYVNGNLNVNGPACGTAWTTCSDRNLKQDIRGVAGALDKVMSLEGVSFLWRTDEYQDRNFDSGRHYGVIAQDVEIIPVLIEAIKAQQGRIEVLEERLAELESQAGEIR